MYQKGYRNRTEQFAELHHIAETSEDITHSTGKWHLRTQLSASLACVIILNINKCTYNLKNFLATMLVLIIFNTPLIRK
jgi:hypothetical protein